MLAFPGGRKHISRQGFAMSPPRPKFSIHTSRYHSISPASQAGGDRLEPLFHMSRVPVMLMQNMRTDA